MLIVVEKARRVENKEEITMGHYHTNKYNDSRVFVFNLSQYYKFFDNS